MLKKTSFHDKYLQTYLKRPVELRIFFWMIYVPVILSSKSWLVPKNERYIFNVFFSLVHTKTAAFSVSEVILNDRDECYVIIDYTKISSIK